MHKLLLLSFFVSLLSLGTSAFSAADASIRSYGAGLENSEWRVSEYSPLQCTLEHHIPRYGDVRFVSSASRSTNMRLLMDMRRLPETYSVADIKSVAPHWRPGVASHQVGEMSLYRQYSSELDRRMAWSLLTELEKGMQPTFFYQDWDNPRDQVSVHISAVNFHDRYEDFLDCVANLLPYSFEDIAFTVLQYHASSDELTNASKRKLMQVSEFLRHDSDIQLILIDAHTDSYGPFEDNEVLAQQRAESVKTMLLQTGVEAHQIQLQAHGERRHAAGNNTELERATNRRVIIQMERPFNPHLLSAQSE